MFTDTIKHLFSWSHHQEIASVDPLALQKSKGALEKLVLDLSLESEMREKLNAHIERLFEFGQSQADVMKRELAASLEQCIRLLEVNAPSTCCFDFSDRLRIVCQVLTMIVRPQDITQGHFRTCNVTTVQNRLFSVEPAAAIKCIADIVLSGEYTTYDESQISMTPDMLWIDSEAAGDELDGRRNLASMIFQRTAVNIYWQRQVKRPDQNWVYKGSLIYEQCRSKTGSNIGERLLDKSIEPPEALDDSPNLGLDGIMGVYRQLSRVDCLSVLALGPTLTGMHMGACDVRSLEHFQKALIKVKQSHGFPVILNLPGHVVLIRDFDEDHCTVAIDNNYSSKFDFLGDENGSNPRKSLKEVYDEMLGPAIDE